MTTKTKKKPLHLSIIVDKLTDLGWDYQRMSRSGRETYDEIMQMLGIIKPDEVYMEID